MNENRRGISLAFCEFGAGQPLFGANEELLGQTERMWGEWIKLLLNSFYHLGSQYAVSCFTHIWFVFALSTPKANSYEIKQT